MSNIAGIGIAVLYEDGSFHEITLDPLGSSCEITDELINDRRTGEITILIKGKKVKYQHTRRPGDIIFQKRDLTSGR